MACGTGEPSLTLARRAPTVRILGVDRAEAMIPLASLKAARESLANARFELMSSERLALPDASMDAAISRFGLMMFGDVPASARELARVLRGGGSFSLAVWDEQGGARETRAGRRFAFVTPRTERGSAQRSCRESPQRAVAARADCGARRAGRRPARARRAAHAHVGRKELAPTTARGVVAVVVGRARRRARDDREGAPVVGTAHRATVGARRGLARAVRAAPHARRVDPFGEALAAARRRGALAVRVAAVSRALRGGLGRRRRHRRNILDGSHRVGAHAALARSAHRRDGEHPAEAVGPARAHAFATMS